ncbi:hypothetical protein FRC04_003704 [Tulasnella sp. 424]|nr:hypothetical protein FRC04_003704 [Tulasnella sp. 424]
MSGPADNNKNTGKKPVNLTINQNPGSNRQGSSDKTVPGLAELLSVIETIAATPVGRSPVIGDDLINRLRGTPLYAAYTALQPVMMKILVSETTVEARSPWKLMRDQEDIPQLKALETGIKAVSKSVDGISKSVAKDDDVASGFSTLAEKGGANRDMVLGAVKTSTTEIKGRVQSLQDDVEKITGSIESEIGDLKNRFERLQKSLVDDAREPIKALQARVTELEARNRELKRVVEMTSSTLLPLEDILETAVNGEFGDRSGSTTNSASQGIRPAQKVADVTALVQGVRDRVLQLCFQCKAIFSVIFPDSVPEIQELESDFEGRWPEAMDAISTSTLEKDLRSEVRSTAQRAAQRKQHLQFFGFITEQIRLGRYFPSQWAEELKGLRSEEFMSRHFDGFASIKALGEDIHRLRKSYKILKKYLPPLSRTAAASGGGWAPFDTI